jgi:glyoxylase-like metal-dependent hydrolase (beta-lactamase superfamily II)
MHTTDRRAFLRAAAAGAAGVLLPRFVSSQDAPVAAARIADGVFHVTGAGGNIVLVHQPEGLLLINGGREAQVAALLSLLQREFGSAAVRVLFNTDWCPDHTGLNATAGGAGARIVAHENTRLWLGTRINAQWQRRVYPPAPAAARPTETFYTRGERTFGRVRVAYGHLGQAHTDGDIYVHVPDAHVLVAGHTVGVGSYPVMDYSTGGWIGGLVNATRTLLDIATPETRVIASRGAPVGRAHLQEQYDMLVAVRDRCVKMLKSGMSAAEMRAAAPTREFDAKWGSPDLFMQTMYPGLWGHARELGGII